MCVRDLAILDVALEHNGDSSHHTYPSSEAKGKAGRKEGCGKSPQLPEISMTDWGASNNRNYCVHSNATISQDG